MGCDGRDESTSPGATSARSTVGESRETSWRAVDTSVSASASASGSGPCAVVGRGEVGDDGGEGER